MTAARKLQIVRYPATDHLGVDALQRFIADLLRPLLAAWLAALGKKDFVGANQFLYIVEGDPTQRIAPDVYVLPKVDPHSAPACWKRWEIPEGPSFALEVVSTDYRKDYEDAPVDYARLGTRELVIFDPRVTPRSRKRVRWQVYRRVGKRGFRLVEKSNEDRVYCHELQCFLRVVGTGALDARPPGTGRTRRRARTDRRGAASGDARDARRRARGAARRERTAPRGAGGSHGSRLTTARDGRHGSPRGQQSGRGSGPVAPGRRGVVRPRLPRRPEVFCTGCIRQRSYFDVTTNDILHRPLRVDVSRGLFELHVAGALVEACRVCEVRIRSLAVVSNTGVGRSRQARAPRHP